MLPAESAFMPSPRAPPTLSLATNGRCPVGMPEPSRSMASQTRIVGGVENAVIRRQRNAVREQVVGNQVHLIVRRHAEDAGVGQLPKR